MKPATFTDATIESEVISSNRPVLVDVGANSCGPCRLIDPIVKELAADYAGRLKVGKLDFDSCHTSAVRFGIHSLPTLLLFKDGNVVDRLVGAVPKQRLVESIEEVLADVRR
ncbi:MAG: thioredoxin domain-containing protein [Gemmatimonadota bacterium]|nr:thioredoxin domain-containing protein [Gemmatimonadota bacterium]